MAAKAPECSIKGRVSALCCIEYLTLRREYEAALTRWGNLAVVKAPGTINWGAERVRFQALCERDAAFDLIKKHCEACATCRKS